MNLRLRKFVVGTLALGVLLGIYALYTRLDETPAAISTATESLRRPVDEVNTPPSQGPAGTIFDVQVQAVRQTVFIHRNERNRIDRKFGFEELLHEQGDQWVVTHPYMELFLPAFHCRVTADRGEVLLETAFGRPMPNDATFKGNVVIHILPTDPNSTWESFIHLDDVGFIAAKSMFSSTRAVRFLSRSVQLVGTGMELIYDENHSRLELFRIIDLDSLRLRSSDLISVADPSPKPRRAASPEPAGPAAAARRSDATSGTDAAPGVTYQCIFRQNVVIDTPERVVAAGDVLAINNIPWADPERTDRAKEVAEPNEDGPIPFRGPDALDTTASSHLEIGNLPESFFDIVVTCDGGFVITPTGGRNAAAVLTDATASGQSAASTGRALDIAPDRQRAVARRIDFDASSYDTSLAGPVEMMFHIDANGLAGGPSGGDPLPLTVKAGDAVRFLAKSNQVLLEGGCSVALHRSEPNMDTGYTLTAPRLTLDLVPDPNAKSEAAVSLRRFVADGGPVAVRALRQSGGRELGWTELNATYLEYLADVRELTARGPGRIWLHNSEPMRREAKEADPNGFSLDRPCYARLMNFDVLRYTASTNRIVAEDDAQQLLLDYFPLTDGGYGRHTTAMAGRVEMSLQEIEGGRMELVSLTASQGIEFQDETDYHFVGSTLVYDHGQSLVTVTGDDVLPCNLNGALVDYIRMNLKTGDIEAPISTPSILRVGR